MIEGNMRPHFVPLSGIVLDRRPISIEFRGKTIEGWYCVENGGVWVHYVNRDGIARRNWADARSNPRAYEVYARMVLRELAEEDIPPSTATTLMVVTPETSLSQIPSLTQRISALDGVLKVKGEHISQLRWRWAPKTGSATRSAQLKSCTCPAVWFSFPGSWRRGGVEIFLSAQTASRPLIHGKAKPRIPRTMQAEDCENERDTEGQTGRPALYSEELGNRICDLVAERVPVVDICAMEGMPSKDTLYRWKRQNKDFSDQCARAREHRADARQDHIDEIASKVLTGEIDPQAARVIIDAEKWQMSKEQPRRYGDKLAIGGDPESGPVKHIIEHVYVKPDRS